MTEHNVHGFVETKFSLVRDKFEANFASGADAGASCCATADGKTVVDLWGGFADEAKPVRGKRTPSSMSIRRQKP
jgi:hypothetical protein